ncbi:MAG: acyl-CoA synthetase (AMP-forming)/AMP-acid ligase [Frankiales bacterium]|nr:acyl-CoA synthetase (AMP-forming)/AMP-acid ligase [Frankiales bacterium]
MTFNLADLYEAVADADPDREVLVVGDRRLTYRQLDERSNRLAHVLSEAGVGAGDAVGLQLANGSEYLEGMLAAFKLSAIPVNINYRYVERELRYLYEDSGIVALLVHRAFATKAAASMDTPLKVVLDVADGTGGPAVPGSVDYDGALASASSDRPPAAGRSDDDLYLIYTGGTTGMPKGVVWRHEDIFKAAMGGGDLTQSGDFATSASDLAKRLPENGITALGAPPLMHAAAHWLAFNMLYTGGKVVLMPLGRFDPAEVWQTISDEKVFNIVLVGDAMTKPMLDHLEANAADIVPDSLWVIASSGAPLSQFTKDRLLALLPGRMLLDSLGSSETGALGAKEGGTFKLNAFTTVMSPENTVVVPGSGVVGKIARRGHVPLRYHNDPEKSAATFVEVDGVRWALTGDDATLEEDGSVTLLGRGSLCINTGGEKVYPEEVEEPLKAHPAVEDALVVGVPDERWGERVVAVVHALGPVTLAELQEHVRESVAGYKVPKDLVLVDKVVRSPAGKADYRWAKETAVKALG